MNRFWDSSAQFFSAWLPKIPAGARLREDAGSELLLVFVSSSLGLSGLCLGCVGRCVSRLFALLDNGG